MSKQNELNSYIAQVRQRLRLGAWVRGAAIFTGTALIVTVALVLVLNRFAFPANGVTGARLALIVALAARQPRSASPCHWYASRAHEAVRKAEAANPELEQRLTTFYDTRTQDGRRSVSWNCWPPTRWREPSMRSRRSLVEDKRLFALGGAGAGLPRRAGVDDWRRTRLSRLWRFAALDGPPKNAQPFYAIAVTPGNIAVRRNSDQLITAQVTGMQPAKAQLFAHYQSAHRWEPVAMQAQPDTGGAATYQFVLAGLAGEC